LGNKISNRDGIILAAGLGNRLRATDSEMIIKPLVDVDNIALLVRTLISLEIADCNRVVIVLGWKAEEIRRQIIKEYKGPLILDFAYNHQYNLNNGVSVLCAQQFISGEYILTMADHILDAKIMYLVRDSHPLEGGATLCVDYKLETIFDIDDATKVLAEGNSIRMIGKKIKKFNCIDTGIFIGTKGLMDSLARIYEQKSDVSLTDGIQDLADSGKVEALDIGEAFWQDVDTPEMLEHAEKLLRTQNRTLENDIRSITSKKA
jgi:1L-myo-inositol 1-phosphate cytidylyltransferase